VCLNLLERIENDENFCKHVITSDESWIFEYNPEAKRQSSEWHTSNSQRPKKARMSKSKIKTTLICFFDSQGFVHKEFVPQGQTVNKQYYREVLERLNKRVHRVRPENADTWLLHHENAPCHTAISVNDFNLKGHFIGSAAPILAWSECVWLLTFPETHIPPQRSSFWNCGQHPKGRNRPAEGTSIWRLTALLPGVGATSPAVCCFPREVLWRG